MAVLGVLKITLRLDDFLEGIPRLRKAVILIVMVYYSERIQMKISKGKWLTRQSRAADIQVPPPSGVT